MGEPAKQDEGPQHRRQTPRVNLEVQVGFNDHTNFYVGFSENISEGGLFVATYDLKPVGTEVEMTFSLPDGTEVTALGIVRWVRDPIDNQNSETPPGLGVQFSQLDDQQLDAIRTFTKLQDPMFYPD